MRTAEDGSDDDNDDQSELIVFSVKTELKTVVHTVRTNAIDGDGGQNMTQINDIA